MRRLLFAVLWVLLCATASFAQNSTALAPQALPGLNVQVRGGTILLANSSIGISNTTVALSNNTTNYVFLSSAGVVQTNTTGFTSTVLPIATVLTAQGQIVDIQDNRPDYIFAGGGSGLPAGPTTPTNGVSSVLTCVTGATPCTAVWAMPGIIVKAAVTGTSYTFDSGATTDRGAYVPRSNSGTNMTDTMPDAGGGNFVSGYFTCPVNVDTGNVTDTISRTSSSQFAIGQTLSNTLIVQPGQAVCLVADANNNWRVLPGIIIDANGAFFLNGSDAITGTTPSAPTTVSGWKLGFGNGFWLGTGTQLEYMLINSGANGWLGLGNTATISNNASSASPSTSAGMSFYNTVFAMMGKEHAGCGFTNLSAEAFLCADSNTHEALYGSNGSSSKGMLVRSQPPTSQKAETGSADANVLTVTPVSLAGTYRACVVVSVSSATSGVISWTLRWTDSNGNVQADIAQDLFQQGTAAPNTAFTTSAAGNYNGCTVFDVNNAGTAIVIKWVGGGTTAAKMSATIEKLI